MKAPSPQNKNVSPALNPCPLDILTLTQISFLKISDTLKNLDYSTEALVATCAGIDFNLIICMICKMSNALLMSIQVNGPDIAFARQTPKYFHVHP